MVRSFKIKRRYTTLSTASGMRVEPTSLVALRYRLASTAQWYGMRNFRFYR